MGGSGEDILEVIAFVAEFLEGVFEAVRPGPRKTNS